MTSHTYNLRSKKTIETASQSAATGVNTSFVGSGPMRDSLVVGYCIIDGMDKIALVNYIQACCDALKNYTSNYLILNYTYACTMYIEKYNNLQSNPSVFIINVLDFLSTRNFAKIMTIFESELLAGYVNRCIKLFPHTREMRVLENTKIALSKNFDI